jgi:azurin
MQFRDRAGYPGDSVFSTLPMLPRLALLFFAATTLAAESVSPRALAPLEVTINTPAAQMKYDRIEFVAAPGQTVQLTLSNHDEMPHNLVVCRPKKEGDDKGLEVAQAAWTLAEKGPERHWVPEDSRVLAHTRSVLPHQVETITFTAPQELGDYPYVCTFPGHAAMMNGTMRVERRVPPFRNLHYRAYRGPFKEFPKFGELGVRALGEGMIDDGLLDAKVFAGGTSYALEFEGLLEVPKDGRYAFTLAGDRGTQLWIDGELRVDLRTAKTWRSYLSRGVLLKAGERRVQVRYWHHGNATPEVTLLWTGPGFKEQPLSRVNLVDRRRQEDADSFVGLPLKPQDSEPVFYRNFLADALPSGFGVGYPGGVNLAWNPVTLNVGAFWTGSFLDAKRHWTGRGGGEIKPSGFAVIRPAPGVALAELAAPDQAWPKAPAKDARFLGYSFDAKRQPTFRYRVGSVEVAETFTPAGDAKTHDAALTRTLVLKTKGSAPAALQFRLLTDDFAEEAGAFVVGKEVRISVPGAQPTVRAAAKAREVLVPIIFRDGQATLTIHYAWIGHHH